MCASQLISSLRKRDSNVPRWLTNGTYVSENHSMLFHLLIYPFWVCIAIKWVYSTEETFLWIQCDAKRRNRSEQFQHFSRDDNRYIKNARHLKLWKNLIATFYLNFDLEICQKASHFVRQSRELIESCCYKNKNKKYQTKVRNVLLNSMCINFLCALIICIFLANGILINFSFANVRTCFKFYCIFHCIFLNGAQRYTEQNKEDDG